jgi:hypothetical protein
LLIVTLHAHDVVIQDVDNGFDNGPGINLRFLGINVYLFKCSYGVTGVKLVVDDVGKFGYDVWCIFRPQIIKFLDFPLPKTVCKVYLLCTAQLLSII